MPDHVGDACNALADGNTFVGIVSSATLVYGINHKRYCNYCLTACIIFAREIVHIVMTVMCFGLDNGLVSLAESVRNLLVNAAMPDTCFAATATSRCI